MVILSITYPNAAGARFDWNYYKETHLPLIGRKFGGFGLNSASVLKGVEDADGNEPQANAIALLTFTSMENGRAALASAEGRDVMADLANSPTSRRRFSSAARFPERIAPQRADNRPIARFSCYAWRITRISIIASGGRNSPRAPALRQEFSTMSRVLHLRMSEDAAADHCNSRKIGVSALETLPSGAIRLVCMSNDGAERARKSLKTKLIKGDMVRERHRPTKPLW